MLTTGRFRMGWATVLCLIGCASIPACSGREFSGSIPIRPQGRRVYVSPDGTPQGEGTVQSPLDIATALSAASPAGPGDTIVLKGGTYHGRMRGDKRLPFLSAKAGAPGNPLLIMPAEGETVHLNGMLQLAASYVWVMGLEIGDLEWDRASTTQSYIAVVGVQPAQGAKDQFVTGCKIINCNLFGGMTGVSLLQSARDVEVYGSLVHDFGRGRHGSGFYTANDKGSKIISNCITYRSAGLGLGVHTYSGQAKNILVTENIFFLAGGRGAESQDNLYLNTGNPMENVRVIGNVAYHPETKNADKPNARLSSKVESATHVNKSAVFKDNYVAGAGVGLSVGAWEDLTVTGNTIWAEWMLVEISSSPVRCGIPTQTWKPDLAGYTLANNTYWLPADPKAFRYADHEQVLPGDLMAFSRWQALGLDRDSRMLTGRNGRPVGTKVFVFPNAHQRGRGNVGVFNWDGHNEVEVDLSKVLPVGAKYKVYNCLDVKQTLERAKPVLAGTYAGGAVRLPMRKDPDCPDFEAFLVVSQP